MPASTSLLSIEEKAHSAGGELLMPELKVNDVIIMLIDLFSKEPQALPDAVKLFLAKDAALDSSLIFDHFFVASSGTTFNAGNRICGYRLRDVDERRSTIGAWDGRQVRN